MAKLSNFAETNPEYPRRIISTILNPGDWGETGTKFSPYGRDDWKKSKSSIKIRKFIENWQEVAENSTFHILERKSGLHSVLDGQNRMEAISIKSAELKKGIKLHIVCVYKESDFKSEEEISDFILRLNTVINQTSGNIFEAYSHLPGFMQDIVACNPSVHVKTTTQRTISASNLLSAFIIAHRTTNPKGSRKLYMSDVSIDKKIKTLKTLKTADIIEMQQFLEWWKPVNDEAIALSRGNKLRLTTIIPLVALYVLWLLNRNRTIINRAVVKIPRSMHLPKIATAKSYNDINQVFNYCLAALNHHCVKDLAVGLDGIISLIPASFDNDANMEGQAQ